MSITKFHRLNKKDLKRRLSDLKQHPLKICQLRRDDVRKNTSIDSPLTKPLFTVSEFLMTSGLAQTQVHLGDSGGNDSRPI